MGVVVGLLGSAPSLLWAVGAMTLIFAPVLAIISVWLYTLMFAFGMLWFAHFTLSRLARMRAVPPPPVDATPEPVVSPPPLPQDGTLP
jgi:hypothetical protein